MSMSKSNISLIDKDNVDHKKYLELTAEKLLEAFGNGIHIPGSGSAAAFSGLMAIELLRTVLKLSMGKRNYAQYKEQFQLLSERLTNESIPKFTELFNKDIQVFHGVSYHRRLRDKAKNDGKIENYNKQVKLANKKLKQATDLPLDLCESSLNLMQTAFIIFDNGFKGARGDSGVAISNLLSSAQGALFIVFLNLGTFRKSKWKDQRMARTVDLATRFTKLQKEAYSRVVTLYNENTNSRQLTLDFYKE